MQNHDQSEYQPVSDLDTILQLLFYFSLCQGVNSHINPKGMACSY